MEKLPTTLTIDGAEYFLAETQMSVHDKHNPGWWHVRYISYDGQCIPHIRIKNRWYYFSVFSPTKEDAVNDMLNKVRKTS